MKAANRPTFLKSRNTENQTFVLSCQCGHCITLPYLTLPPGWKGSYTCPVLRPHQLSPMHVPECNHKVTGSDYKAINGCEAVNRQL